MWKPQKPLKRSAAALLLLPLALTSCERKSSDTRPPVDTSNLAGTWVEVRDPNDPGLSPRARGGGASGEYRILHLEDAGSWWLALGSAAGKPADEARMEGDWKADGPRVVFKLASNGLGEERAGLAPMDTVGVVNVAGRGGASLPRLRVSHINGEYLAYKRAK